MWRWMSYLKQEWVVCKSKLRPPPVPDPSGNLKAWDIDSSIVKLCHEGKYIPGSNNGHFFSVQGNKLAHLNYVIDINIASLNLAPKPVGTVQFLFCGHLRHSFTAKHIFKLWQQYHRIKYRGFMHPVLTCLKLPNTEYTAKLCRPLLKQVCKFPVTLANCFWVTRILIWKQ